MVASQGGDKLTLALGNSPNAATDSDAVSDSDVDPEAEAEPAAAPPEAAPPEERTRSPTPVTVTHFSWGERGRLEQKVVSPTPNSPSPVRSTNPFNPFNRVPSLPKTPANPFLEKPKTNPFLSPSPERAKNPFREADKTDSPATSSASPSAPVALVSPMASERVVTAETHTDKVRSLFSGIVYVY